VIKVLDLDVLLPRVTKPARYTDGEWNAIHKDRADARVSFALVYPDTYEVGMSHLGLQILYHVLNGHPDYLAERAYAPWGDMEEQLRAHGLPLMSLESGTPLREFDVVGITLPYELTYTNVLNVLDLSGIPIRAAERGPDDPIVLGGGPGSVNPEPMCEFFDAVLVGEGEDAVLEIAEAAAEGEREAKLERLVEIPGVYVPSCYEFSAEGAGPVGRVTPRNGAPAVVERRIVADLDSAPFPTRQLVPFIDTVHSRATLEIMRGCARGCRFCQAGATYGSRRERRVGTLLEQAEAALAATGYDEVSLLAFTSVDHSRIEELVDEIVGRYGRRGIGVALPSLRADAFSVGLANKIQQVRKTGLTFAPEAGTDRLRGVINKRMSEDELFAAADAAFSSGWTRLKLYFMIGLPTETEGDVEAICDLVRRLVDFGRGVLGTRRRRLRIAVSVAAFVPKPHTPFQWAGQATRETLLQRQGIIQQGLRGPAIRLSWTDAGASALEAAISRGDRRVGRVIEAAWRKGAKFDAWGEQFEFARWEEAFREVGINLTDYANRSLGLDERLAWDHVSCGVGKALLREGAERALAEGGV
jgi:radical SAM family uncharacterized protein